MRNVYQHYQNKNFFVPKALFFGRYANLSIEARMYYGIYTSQASYDLKGYMCLNIVENPMIKPDVLNELLAFNLIEIQNEFVYFNDIIIDNEMISAIDQFENSTFSNRPTAPSVESNNKDEVIETKRVEFKNKAYYKNTNIPQEIGEVLENFSSSIEEAKEFYSIILKAKKRVETELDMMVWIDDDEELTEHIINAFVRAIETPNLKNRNGYIYKAVYTAIFELQNEKRIFVEKKNPNSPINQMYNWLEPEKN